MDLKFFKLGVSTKGYTTKPNFRDVKYNTKENIGINGMVELIRGGYSFSHTFHVDKEYGNKEKTIANFKQTNFIWFDFDDCIDSLTTTHEKLTYKPNLAYTTISNNQEGKSNRFRIIYILDFKINSNDSYKHYLNILLNTIIKDLGKEYLKYIDNKCFNVSLHMFGSNNNSTIITNNTIFNKSIFENIINSNTINNLIDYGKCSKKLKSNNLKKEEKILKQTEGITTPISELIELLQSTDIRAYQPILSNEHLAILDNDIYTDVSEQNIYKITSLYNKDNKIQRVKKGHRNNMLFVWGITIRNMNSAISIEDLAKHLYWLYIFRCERTDDFDMYQVCSIAINAYKADLNDYRELGKRKYLINPENKDLSRIEKAKALGKARKKSRDNNILPNYDLNKSPKENANELEVSENTIRNCLKDNGVKTPNQTKYDKFVEIYDGQPNLSIRKLVELTGLSDKTIQKYKKKLEKELVEGL